MGHGKESFPCEFRNLGEHWLSQCDIDAIGGISSGGLCSLSAGLVCVGVGDQEIAGRVTAAADVVQLVFVVKSLLKAGVSLAAIAIIVKRYLKDLASLATKVIGEGCYQTGECKVAATALKKEFEKNGIKGTLVRLTTPDGEAIFRGGKQIAEEATEGHFGVLVDGKVYEMNSTKGVPLSNWAKGYEYRSGTHAIRNPIVEVMPSQ